MAKRTGKNTIQVFIVSWFPIGATEACTMTCLTRAYANDRVAELQRDFAPYPNHDPLIQIDRSEERASF